jgi:[glutamine synthetase] adenylyltransferase / [glutamine synthetase]-adenylyl-L-tyrosine phosphorylase
MGEAEEERVDEADAPGRGAPTGRGPRVSLQTAIERSASPAAVAVATERLSETASGVRDRLEADHVLRDAVVAVLAASRSLTELLMSDPVALDVLADLAVRPVLEGGPSGAGGDADPDAPAPAGPPILEAGKRLHRWQRLELLRIAARDLTGLDDLPAVGRALARLADEVLQAAATMAGADPGLAVIGMGKLGGRELNYSSDIDIMFVGDPRVHDRTARAVLDIARSCYRVDVDLRPEGRDGPLVRTLESYEAYWERWAHTWEFQALLKARPVAGDPELGAAFLERSRARVWDRPFTLDDLRAVRSMKARSEEMLAKKGLTDREVKRGRGGIRDIEFSVQLLQLVHGRADPELRSPTTLDALAEMGAHGYVDPADARALDAAYRLLRTVEHRLQLVHEQQVHTLPAPSDLGGGDRMARGGG